MGKWDELIKTELEKGGTVDYSFARKHGIPERSFRRVMQRLSGVENATKPKKPKQKKSPATGLDDFLNQFDDSVIIPRQIEEGIKSHLQDKEGNPCWLKDNEFRTLCGVSTGRWRKFADAYTHLQVKVQGQIIWGHKDIIDEMRRAVQR